MIWIGLPRLVKCNMCERGVGQQFERVPPIGYERIRRRNDMEAASAY